MKIQQYKLFIEQRELLLADTLAAAGKLTRGAGLPAKCTITANGKQYPVEPIKQETVAAYRKRFKQVDAAVKGMLGREGTLETITVNMAGRQYKIEPTPEQERELNDKIELEAAEYVYKMLGEKKHRDTLEQSLWEQLDAAYKAAGYKPM